jgi:hypothetical protein
VRMSDCRVWGRAGKRWNVLAIFFVVEITSGIFEVLRDLLALVN